jgi:hypothetical protein
MADLLFVALTLAFFAVAGAYVALCDRIIGPDPAPLDDATSTDAPEAVAR